MACRGFTSPHHPKSVTYVLNLFCIRSPEPAPGGATVPPFHTPLASLSSCSPRLDKKGGLRSVWYCFAPISPPHRYSSPSVPLPRSTCAQFRRDAQTMTRPIREFLPESHLR